MNKPALEPLSDKQLQKSIYTAALLALFLPPSVGGTLMGVMGFYPLPEIYFTFLSYTGLYVLAVLALVLSQLPSVYHYIVSLGEMGSEQGEVQARYVFIRLPWILLTTITLYSIFGALSVDFTLERMGYQQFALHDYLYSLLGIIPVVLITIFPIFFYFVDRLGRYLGPRGLSVTAVPLWVKLLMLGIVTPLLIDSVLISYFYNRTGYFEFDTLILWVSLLVMAVGGTWFAWRSLRQGIVPLEQFMASKYDDLNENINDLPMPQSLDELGVLTTKFVSLLRKQNELAENLKRAELLANMVINDAGALVIVLNNEGRIVRFNRACEHVSGYSFEEIENKFPWDTVLPPESASLIKEQAFDAIANDPSVMAGSYTNEWETGNGGRCLIEWNNTVIIENGQLVYMVSVGIDVTEKDQAEKKLVAAVKEAETANKAKSDFLAAMSHDLRTPLNAVIGFSEIMMMGINDTLGKDKYPEYAGHIYSSGQYLLSLINDILDMSELAAKERRLAFEELDIEEVLTNCRQMLHKLAEDKTIDYQLNVPDDLLPLRADKKSLLQIVMNVTSNAIKFTPENGTITTSVHETDSHHIIEITDTGVGISQEQLENVTKPFVRVADGSSYAHNQGTGLGLAITKSLIDLHNGKLGFKSVLGEGTTVTITIPSGTSSD